MGKAKEVGFYISVDNHLEFIETNSQEESLELAKIYLDSKKIHDYVIFKNGIKLNEEAEKNLKILGLKMYNRMIEYPKDTYSTIVHKQFKSIKNNEIKVKEIHLNEKILEKKEILVENDMEEKENIVDVIETIDQKYSYFSQLETLPKVLAILAYPLGIVILFFLTTFGFARVIYEIFGCEKWSCRHKNILDIRHYVHMDLDLSLQIFFLILIIILIIYSRFLFKKH